MKPELIVTNEKAGRRKAKTAVLLSTLGIKPAVQSLRVTGSDGRSQILCGYCEKAKLNCFRVEPRYPAFVCLDCHEEAKL